MTHNVEGFFVFCPVLLFNIKTMFWGKKSSINIFSRKGYEKIPTTGGIKVQLLSQLVQGMRTSLSKCPT
jgi:hypothetical protein